MRCTSRISLSGRQCTKQGVVESASRGDDRTAQAARVESVCTLITYRGFESQSTGGGHGIEDSALREVLRRLRAGNAAVDIRRARAAQAHRARAAGIRLCEEAQVPGASRLHALADPGDPRA